MQRVLNEIVFIFSVSFAFTDIDNIYLWQTIENEASSKEVNSPSHKFLYLTVFVCLWLFDFFSLFIFNLWIPTQFCFLLIGMVALNFSFTIRASTLPDFSKAVIAEFFCIFEILTITDTIIWTLYWGLLAFESLLDDIFSVLGRRDICF